MQHVATHCNTLNLLCAISFKLTPPKNGEIALQRPRTHLSLDCCSIKLDDPLKTNLRCAITIKLTFEMHTATHCKTLQRTATRCNTLQHTATHCNSLQHTSTHCNTLQHTATHCNTLQHTATCCSTLQHTEFTLCDNHKADSAQEWRNCTLMATNSSFTGLLQY